MLSKICAKNYISVISVNVLCIKYNFINFHYFVMLHFMCSQLYADPVQRQAAGISFEQAVVKTEEDLEPMLDCQMPRVQPVAVGNLMHTTWSICLNCLA